MTEGGHARCDVNGALAKAVCFVAVAMGLGYSVDVFSPRKETKEGDRPQNWLRGMLVASYLLLIPGLLQVLFSFSLAIDMVGLHVLVTRDPFSYQPGSITQSMTSLIQVLHKTHSNMGVFLVVMYAMVVPLVKFVLLLVGELWRFSKCEHRVQVARRCIRLVQLASKWACPDMFAYILMLYLARALEHRSPLLETPTHLDVGFTCFSVFCICSTFSSLALRLPKAPGKKT